MEDVENHVLEGGKKLRISHQIITNTLAQEHSRDGSRKKSATLPVDF